MTPARHLPADWLVGWAAGVLPAPERVIVSTHLTLCPLCRAHVRLAESVAAEALDTASPVPLDPVGLDRVLARLGDAEPAPVVDPAGVYPAPLLGLIGSPDALRWRWLAPYVQGVDLMPSDGLPLRLVRMRAGAHLAHRHTGPEAGVVLQGGWSDQTGRYARGDVAIYDAEFGLHDQRIDPGEDCVALVLNASRGVAANPLVAFVGRWLFSI